MPNDDPPVQDVAARSTLLAPRPHRVSLSRSPHPYHRRSEGLPGKLRGDESTQVPAASSSRSDSSESGTEADDERGPILKGLPAPPLRSHKGLKGSTPIGLSPAITPLPSPPATVEAAIQETFDYFGAPKEWRLLSRRDESPDRKRREVYIRRKKGEILRRATEVLLLLVTALLSFLSAKRSSDISQWSRELLAFLAVPTIAYGLYPVRKVQLAYKHRSEIAQSLATGLHLPSRFDPGPLLYPVVLPIIVAFSLEKQRGAPIPVNIVCGLSSIPSVVTNIWNQPMLMQYLRWNFPILPLHVSEPVSMFPLNTIPFSLKVGTSQISQDDLALIPPLHDTLKSILQQLTTTSLDPAELELLTTGMINLLYLSMSPQAQLLSALLWVGGLCILVSCRHLLIWEVDLARIPKWKFSKRRVETIAQQIARFLSALKAKPVSTFESSDDDVDNRAKLKPLLRVKTLAAPRQRGKGPMSATGLSPNGTTGPDDSFRRPHRRSTISGLDPVTKMEAEKQARRSNLNPALPRSQFLSLTAPEAKLRKYLYAAAVYVLVTLIALGPVRIYISSKALSNYEPFGWAIGYLFGNIPIFADSVKELHWNDWIPLPTALTFSSPSKTSWRQILGQHDVPAGNLRLLLCAYCLTILFLGIIAVLSLTSFVEVDTRRKGFHGVMVMMLLPTVFFDPCFFSLALSLILAAFLLLDMFRASQLPPISRPLTNFLAPYVDGRDHRGPVIVSHIFLLIGCAIPLWLSLAGLPRLGLDPWQGWDTPERNLSMICGVVCVGMGDAAASLIGRRYGKTKWYWGGGKSLEGSLAFTLAVTVGLMFSYIWLRVGGWHSWDDFNILRALVKSVIAGTGASLLESVLTSANDNVVVPIGLWLLVRGLEI